MTGRLAAMLLAVAVGSGCSSDEAPPPVTLARVEVTPPAPSLAAGTTAQLRATALYSDGGRRDVTFEAAWSSSVPAVASIADGLLRGAAPGSASVRALFQGMEGSAAVEVTAATLVSLSIDPPALRLAAGRGGALVATGLFSDGTTQDVTEQATWTSDDTGVAVASGAAGSRGRVDAFGAGTAVVRASVSGRSATATVSVSAAEVVSIGVEPPSLTVALGATSAFTATAVYSDGTTADVTADVLWTASGAVATFPAAMPAGTVRPISVGGPVAILAVLPGAAVTGAATLTVTPATLVSIDVTPASLTLAKGAARRLVATGVYSDATRVDLTSTVAWNSASPGVISVASASGDEGLVTAVSVGGPVRVTATAPGGAVEAFCDVSVSPAALVSLEISPASARIAAGGTRAFSATATWSDGTSRDVTGDATWTSADPSVAPVSSAAGSSGVATGLRAGGPVAIAAQLPGSTITAIASVTVEPPSLVRVEVSPAIVSLAKGTSVQLRALARFSDGSVADVTGQSAWASAEPGVAAVSNAPSTTGTVSGVAVGGPVVVSATFLGVSATASEVTVTPAVLVRLEVAPADVRIPLGTAQQLTATGTFSDGTTQDLTSQVGWLSSTPTTASVSNASGANGRAQSHAEGGPVAITATFPGTAISAGATLAVDPPALLAISVTPAVASIPKGRTQRFTATGSYTDGVFRDVGAAASWTSSAPGTATLSAVAGEEGLARGATAGGPVTIQAAVGAVSGEAKLTVRPAEIVSLVLAPDAPWLERGATLQLAALATYTDGLVVDVASTATWSSSSPLLVPVSAGLVQGRARGSSVVEATAGGITGAVTVNVVARRPVSLAIVPADVAVAPDAAVAFVAVGTFADGTQGDVTREAAWTSSDEAVAVPSPDEPGAFVAGVAGTATVTATLGASASTSMTVTASPPAPSLTALTVRAEPGRLRAGGLVQLHATGWFSDATSRDVTEPAAWSTSNPAIVAVVSGAPGVVSAAAPGSADVTATFGGRSATLTVTVLDASSPVAALDLLAPASVAVSSGSLRAWATATRADGGVEDVSAAATWSSSDPGVIAHVEGGWFDVAGAGTATVEVTFGGVSAAAPVRVLTDEEMFQALDFRVLPADATVKRGTWAGFGLVAYDGSGIGRAIDVPVWESADPELMEFLGVMPGFGAGFLAAGVGTTTVYPVGLPVAYDEARVTLVEEEVEPTVAAIVVTSAVSVVQVGGRASFEALVVMSNGRLGVPSVVAWESSDPAILAPDPTGPGWFEGIGVGHATVTATAPSGVTASVPVDVVPAPATSYVLIRGPGRVPVGGAIQLIAEGLAPGDSVAWTSGNPSLAAFDPAAPGMLRGLAPGTVRVYATTPSGVVGFADVAVVTVTRMTVLPAHGEVESGWRIFFRLKVEYSDGSREILSDAAVWTSSDASVAMPNEEYPSEFVGIYAGDATIQAEYASSTATATLAVRDGPVSPRADSVFISMEPDLLAGETAEVFARIVYTDGYTAAPDASFAWTSSAPGVVTFDDPSIARVRGVSAGTADVTVTGPGGISDTAPAIVRGLSKLEISPANPSVPLGGRTAVQALATDDRGEVREVTSLVSWSTGDTGIATFPDVTGLGPIIEGVERGSTWVRAEWPGGVIATGTVTVTDPVPASVQIEAFTQVLELGDTAALRAIATLTDGTTADVTASAAWAVDQITTVIEATGTAGVYRAAGVGTARITVEAQGTGGTLVIGETDVWVRPPISSAAIEPSDLELPLGVDAPVNLVVTRVDGSVEPKYGGTVTWTADGVFTEFVEPGVVRALAEGIGEIAAEYAGYVTTAAVEVVPPQLVTWVITGPESPLESDQVARFALVGTMTDGSTRDLTASAAWSSHDSCVAEPEVEPGAFRAGTCSWGPVTVEASFQGKWGPESAFAEVEYLPRYDRVELVPWYAEVAAGLESEPFLARAVRIDGTSTDVSLLATWTVDPAMAVTVEAKPGVFRGVASGLTDVVASWRGLSGSAELRVRPPLVLDFSLTCPTEAFEPGQLAACTAEGTRSDGTSGDVTAELTWRSDSPSVAVPSFGAPGTFEAVGWGTATVAGVAQAPGATIERTSSVTFLAPVTGFEILPGSHVATVGSVMTFSALLRRADGQTTDVTSTTAWWAEDAVVSPTSTPGQFVATGEGPTIVWAEHGAHSMSASVLVVAP